MIHEYRVVLVEMDCFVAFSNRNFSLFVSELSRCRVLTARKRKCISNKNNIAEEMKRKNTAIQVTFDTAPQETCVSLQICCRGHSANNVFNFQLKPVCCTSCARGDVHLQIAHLNNQNQQSKNLISSGVLYIRSVS